MKDKKPKAPKAKAPAKAKKVVKKEPIKIEKISARHDFTEAEIGELGKKLAGLTAHKTRTEEEKKVVVGQWSMKVKEIQGEIASVSANLTNGYEMRDTECEVQFDWKSGKKTYVRVLDRKVIETRNVTDPERQQHLKFEADQKAPKIVPMKPPEPGEPLVPVGAAVDAALKKAEEPKESSEPAEGSE